jgi:hypothetical protein
MKKELQEKKRVVKMRNEFIGLLTQMAERNINIDVLKNIPSYLTRKALIEGLKHVGFNRELAFNIGVLIEINVSESFVNDKELFDLTIETNVQILSKIMDELMDNNIPLEEIQLMIKGNFSISYGV